MKEGRDYDVVATLPARIDGAEVYYDGVSPDGMVFGSTHVEDPDAPEVFPGGLAITFRSSVILLDPGSGKVMQISDGNARPRRTAVSGIDVNEDWVTWLESEDAEGGSWKLYSYDRSTKTERRLGSSKDAIKADGVGFELSPKISGDRAVMSAFAYGGDETGKADQVLSAPLDGSAPLTELVGRAAGVDADADGISYTITSTQTLMFRDTASAKTKVIDAGETSFRTYHSGVLVTGVPYGSGTKVRATKDGTTTTFGPFVGDAGYNYQEKGWAKFVTDPDGDAKIYAIDTDRMKLFKVANTQGGWELMGNDMAIVSPFDGAKGASTLIKLR
ncbi:MAG: hypothetical protein QOH68_336 [Nocardioidaceae bacterium]|nr:hypothetical protein [Nocardioidaceae bacterium]